MKKKYRTLLLVLLCILAVAAAVLYVMHSIELSLNDIYSSP